MDEQTAINELIRRLGARDAEAVEETSRQLASFGQAAVEPLTGVLSGSDRWQTVNAVGVLEQIGGRGVARVLLNLRKHPHPIIRMVAAKSIGRTGDYRSARGVVVWLEDERDANVQCWLVISLARLCGARAFNTFVGLIDEVCDNIVRNTIIQVLGEMGDRRAVTIIQHYLADPDHHIRESAKEALARLGHVTGGTVG